MATIEPVVFKIGRILLECLCEALADNANEDPTLPMPQRCCFRAGAEVPLGVVVDGFVITDQCCLGEAYVKFTTEYPSSTFPQPDEGPVSTPCQLTQMAVNYEMGVIRCIREEPDCTESSEKFRMQAADSEAMYAAVCCWQKRVKKEIDRGSKWFASGAETAGPDGGCLMTTMLVQSSRRGPACC